MSDLKRKREVWVVELEGKPLASGLYLDRELAEHDLEPEDGEEIVRYVPAEPEQAGKAQGTAQVTQYEGARVYGDLFPALQKLADSWQSSSSCLRGEVARGIAVRQSEESKLSRAEVLDSCAEQIRRLLPAPPTKDPTNG